jgi:hypothetical protein
VVKIKKFLQIRVLHVEKPPGYKKSTDLEIFLKIRIFYPLVLFRLSLKLRLRFRLRLSLKLRFRLSLGLPVSPGSGFKKIRSLMTSHSFGSYKNHYPLQLDSQENCVSILNWRYIVDILPVHLKKKLHWTLAKKDYNISVKHVIREECLIIFGLFFLMRDPWWNNVAFENFLLKTYIIALVGNRRQSPTVITTCTSFIF